MGRKLKKGDISALGGEDADLELLNGVDSDADVPAASSSKTDRGLAKDLSKFMKELKLPAAAEAEAESSSSKPKSKKDKHAAKTASAATTGEESNKTTSEKKQRDKAEKSAKKDKQRDGKPSSEPAPTAGKKEKKKDGKPSKAPTADTSTAAPHDKKANKKAAASPFKSKLAAEESSPAKTEKQHIRFEAPVAAETKPAPSSSKGGLLVPASSNWYTVLPALPAPTKPLPAPTTEKVASLSTRAASLLAEDVARYDAHSSTSSGADAQFLSRVLSSGTLSDRLSALTLLAQGSPLHNQRALESLRALAQKKSREQSLKALRAIADWWAGGGAPDRKLKYFRDQPLGHPQATDAHLVVWFFEDWLKKYFYGILQILEALSMDPLPYVRIQAVTFIFQLLRDKPEQEQNLLRLLVNKLGDTDRPVASRVSYQLMQLVQAHPQMKGIIISEVSASIFGGREKEKEKRSQRARYYAVITFNQMVLSAREGAVADRLMDLYFKLFQEMLGEDTEKEKGEDAEEEERPKKRRKVHSKDKKKGKKGAEDEDDFASLEESDSKMISAILTGINRALPFASLTESSFTRHIDTLFRITHEATFNISVQALMLIDHIVSSSAIPSGADLSNRFYRTLYAALLDARLPGSGKHALFLTLLSRAMRRDAEPARAAAFARRLLQALAGHGPGFACAALVMLGRLVQLKPALREMIRGPPDPSNEEGAKYDPAKREPLYAHAEGTCLWELVPLLHHYHPSVALHARQLRDGERLTGAPDVGLYALAGFLDRFVLKNAKKKPAVRGASAMQPVANAHEKGAADALDDEDLAKLDEDQVAADQLFYHRFVKLKGEREQKMASKAGKRKKKGEDDEGEDVGVAREDGEGDDDEEEGSELDEDEVWAAMKRSAADLDVDPDVDEDSDLEMPDEDEEDDSDASHAEDDDDESVAEGAEDDAAASGGDESAAEQPSDAEDDSEGEMEFLEEDDDVMGDDELIDLADLMPSEDEEEEWGGVDAPEQGTKRKRGKADDAGNKKNKKKRLRDLPTFATYEDYQRMIDETPEDNI